MWAITGEKEVDILIANIGDELTDDYIALRTSQLKAANPVMGDFIRGGRVADIPVRQPLSMLVADGYAAIGDAAFMTIPLKGSGVGHSMRAGKILADVVIADEKCFYNRAVPIQAMTAGEAMFSEAISSRFLRWRKSSPCISSPISGSKRLTYSILGAISRMLLIWILLA